MLRLSVSVSLLPRASTPPKVPLPVHSADAVPAASTPHTRPAALTKLRITISQALKKGA
jgi:hypothetical protein